MGGATADYYFSRQYQKIFGNPQNTSSSYLNEGNFPSTLFLVIEF